MNIFQFFKATVVVLGALFLVTGIVYAANTFPTTLNDWESGEIIESDWADSLEDKIGVDGSTVESSIDYILSNGIFPATSTISVGGTSSSTLSNTVSTLVGDFIVDSNTFTVDSAADTVGVGTASPTYEFQVSGSVQASGLVDASHFVATSSTASTTLAGDLIVGTASTPLIYSDVSGRTVQIGSSTAATNVKQAQLVISELLTSGSDILTPKQMVQLERSLSGTNRVAATIKAWRWETSGVSSRSALTFGLRHSATDNTNIMSLISNGHVGIGTTTPYARLAITNTSTDDSFRVEDSSSIDHTPFVIDASGNVGIGLETPIDPLHVVTDSGGDAIHLEENNGGEDWQLGINTAGDLNFQDSGNTVVTFEDGGDVGFGTTSPYVDFGVTGSVAINNGSNSTHALSLEGGGSTNSASIRLRTTSDSSNLVIEFQDDSPSDQRVAALNFLDSSGLARGQVLYQFDPTQSDHFLSISVNSSERLRIDGSGNVGIGSTTPEFLLGVQAPSGTTTIDVGGSSVPTCIQAWSPGGNAVKVYVTDAGVLTSELGNCSD